jgi:hypothetical protein
MIIILNIILLRLFFPFSLLIPFLFQYVYGNLDFQMILLMCFIKKSLYNLFRLRLGKYVFYTFCILSLVNVCMWKTDSPVTQH